MQDNLPKITIVHDTRYASRSQEGKYPAKIRVTFKVETGGKNRWVQKLFLTGYMLTPEEFAKVTNAKAVIRQVDLDKVRDKLNESVAKAKEVAQEARTPEVFEARFTGSGNRSDVISYFKAYESELLTNDQVGTAENVYGCARNSFVKFVFQREAVRLLKISQDCVDEFFWIRIFDDRRKEENKPVNLSKTAKFLKKYGLGDLDLQLLNRLYIQSQHISFAEITERWILSYEKWFLSRGNSIATLSLYLRSLRSIFNQAIKDKKITRDIYPFEDYQIPTMTGTKWAPTDKERITLLEYNTDDLRLRKSLDYFLFSYYCSGINPADIAHLKFKMIDGKFMVLLRKKTKTTEKNVRYLRIPLLKEAREIMMRWGNKSLNPNDYVFPILSYGMTAKQQKTAIDEFIRDVNEDLEQISQELGIHKKLTFGIGRHMFTTTMRRMGVATEYVQHQLGHASPRTTEIYWHGFEDEASFENANLLRSNVS
jgi:integrase